MRSEQGAVVGGRLPSMALRRVGSEGRVQVRGDGRNPAMLFFAHSAACEECRRWVAGLLRQKDAFEVWGGRLLVIVPDETGAEGFPAGATFPLHLLVDEDGTLARRCGIEGAGLVVADAWGEVHFTTRAGEGHDLPSGAEVEEWLKFLAIQCPECEQPEGLWRSI